MLLIQKISAAPLQKQTLVLPSGDSVTLTLYFIPMQQGWFITELTYGTFVLQGLRITNSPNMLSQWRYKLPFGLGCFSIANREPSLQDDFVTPPVGEPPSKLYILTGAECLEYVEYLKSGS